MPQDAQLNLRMTAAQKAQWTAQAAQEGRTLSNWIKHHLDGVLQKKAPVEPPQDIKVVSTPAIKVAPQEPAPAIKAPRRNPNLDISWNTQ